VAVWRSGNIVDHVNEVAQRRARLVLGWVNVRGYSVFVCDQLLWPTQPSTFSGMINGYMRKSSSNADWLGR